MSVKSKNKFSDFVLNYFPHIVIVSIVIVAGLLFINRNAVADFIGYIKDITGISAMDNYKPLELSDDKPVAKDDTDIGGGSPTQESQPATTAATAGDSISGSDNEETTLDESASADGRNRDDENDDDALAAAFSQNVITEFEEDDSSFFQDISDEENSFLTDKDED